LRKELAKSSLFGVLQFAVNIVLSVVAIPIFVAKLGLTAFGLFSIVTLLGNLNSFTNLGLNTFLVQFLADNGKSRLSDRHVLVTFSIMFMVLVPLTVVCLSMRDKIMSHILNIPLSLFDDGRWLFNCIILSNVLLLLGQVFVAILDSQQKVFLSSIWQTVYNATYWIFILIAILLGFSLKGVAAALVFSAIVWFVLVAKSALNSWGKISTGNFRHEFFAIAKIQLAFGVQVYLSGLANMLFEPLTKILVSHWIGIRGVAILDVGLRVKNGVYGAISRMFYPLFPYLVKIKEPERIRKVVHDVSQKGILLALPLSVLVLVSSKPIVALFFHQDTSLISLSISVFLVSYLLGSVTVIPIYYYLLSHGHVGITLTVQLINAIANLTFFTLLHNQLGYVAVITSSLCAMASSFTYLLYCQGRLLHSFIFDSLEQGIKVIAAFILILVITYVMTGFIEIELGKIVAACAMVLLLSTILYRTLGVVSQVDVARYFGDNTFSRLVGRALCH
jgi:O-antigen/teichoic acid export membrane protein